MELLNFHFCLISNRIIFPIRRFPAFFLSLVVFVYTTSVLLYKSGILFEITYFFDFLQLFGILK